MINVKIQEFFEGLKDSRTEITGLHIINDLANTIDKFNVTFGICDTIEIDIANKEIVISSEFKNSSIKCIMGIIFEELVNIIKLYDMYGNRNAGYHKNIDNYYLVVKDVINCIIYGKLDSMTCVLLRDYLSKNTRQFGLLGDYSQFDEKALLKIGYSLKEEKLPLNINRFCKQLIEDIGKENSLAVLCYHSDTIFKIKLAGDEYTVDTMGYFKIVGGYPNIVTFYVDISNNSLLMHNDRLVKEFEENADVFLKLSN